MHKQQITIILQTSHNSKQMAIMTMMIFSPDVFNDNGKPSLLLLNETMCQSFRWIERLLKNEVTVLSLLEMSFHLQSVSVENQLLSHAQT